MDEYSETSQNFYQFDVFVRYVDVIQFVILSSLTSTD